MVQHAHLRTLIEEDEVKALAHKKKDEAGEFEKALAKSDALATLDYHKREVTQLFKDLGTDAKTGLTTAQAAEKAKIFGPNKLKERDTFPWYVKLLLEMVGLYSCILWAGSALSFLGYALDSSDPSNVYIFSKGSKKHR